MATQSAPARAAFLGAVEPTFYLGGQTYVLDRDDLLKDFPELAEMAFYETWRQMYGLMTGAVPGLTAHERGHRLSELSEGAWRLRQCFQSFGPLVPNGHFHMVH